jgi:hypothetical protein
MRRAALLLLFLGAPAWAQSTETSLSKSSDHAVAITMSPIHLAVPFVELMGELRAHPQVGVAAIAGAGRVDDITVWEAGGQFNYYLIGSFDHGMQLGVEAMYLHADKTESGIAAAADGLAIGPYVGYKVAMNVGFTFNAQLGAQAAVLRGEASSSTATAMTEQKDVFPLVNLNVGWSF